VIREKASKILACENGQQGFCSFVYITTFISYVGFMYSRGSRADHSGRAV
jgi:hypothetical protein